MVDLWREYQRRVGSLSRAGAAVRLVDRLFTHPFFTIPDAARFLRQTYPAAPKNAEKLVEAGILKEKTGYARNRVFTAPEALLVINRPFGEIPLLPKAA